ncbi:MAG: energy transducer TonB [Alistipes sp.]
MATDTPKRPPQRPRIRLPFDNRKEDAGEWAFDHRVGLCITVIAYLLLAIGFVASKIVVGEKADTQGITIDLTTLAELEAQRDRLEREVKQKQAQDQDKIDWSSVRNQVSNDNVVNENIKDDRGTKAAELNASAASARDRMAANREAYEKGLAEAAAIRDKSDKETSGSHQAHRIKGNVTVRVDLKDPIRTERELSIPAYQCEGGGEVVVEITVNRAGAVVAAEVISGGDNCMQQTALKAARISRFNIDNAAPARQIGTITYLFIPQ